MKVAKPRFYSLWAINGALEQSHLRRQLDQLKAAGLDGVVFHPRFYPNQPVYLSDGYLKEVSDAILHAKSIGLAFWFYDEDGWPSGTVSGQLLKKYPADAQRYADLVVERPERCLAEFEKGGKKWYLAECLGRGVDYLNPDFSRHFLELTHERYRTGLKAEAWEYVEAIFSDEPEFGLGRVYDSLSRHGSLPWTPRLPELFRQRFGEDLWPQISNLFFPGEGAAQMRVRFWELLTDVFNESFTAPINDWCRQHGKLFTAHLKGEEHPLFQVPMNGSCHQFNRHLDLPGIDALERYPANNFYPRQVSSVARQFGSGRCMVEAFGGAGWGAAPEDLERHFLWLGRNGLTDFVLHLSQYRLDSAAMCDWPPSQPLNVSWHEVYPEVLRRVRRDLEKNPRPCADVLVVAPIRGIMANYEPWELLQINIHNAATYPDTSAGQINRRFLACIEDWHRAGVNFDVTDERTLEQFGRLVTGEYFLNYCKYRHVIVDQGCQLSPEAWSLVKSLAPAPPVAVLMPPSDSPMRAESQARASIPVCWSLKTHPLNCMLLECDDAGSGQFAASFAARTPFSPTELQFVFADDVTEAELNGTAFKIVSGDAFGSEGVITDGCLIQNSNTLRFRTARLGVQRPFVWVRGLFRVMSGVPFVPGPNRTVKTEGPWTLHPARGAITADLIGDGFPFLRESLTVVGTVQIPIATTSLRLNEAEADAIRLVIDARDYGWTWRTNGEFRFEVDLRAGEYHLQIELIPNTFNAFGPHHYYVGDWHVVSPDQIKGVRNFADPSDAPASTHVKAWHFRRLQLPAQIST
jgi:hypothetical protein